MIRPLHVAAAVIRAADGRILIARRAKNAHQGGLWEFPGGKLEAGESAEQALVRELWEEVGIRVERATPLIKIRHRYPDLLVLLDVWSVEAFSGEAKGCEGQVIRWVEPERLLDYRFPAANVPIVNAARLPAYYAIVEAADPQRILADLQKLLANGIGLIQLRSKALPAGLRAEVVERALALCRTRQAKLLLNSAWADTMALQADGLHLTSADLLACRQRPAGYAWLAASCHTVDELQHAERLGVDFAVLAPVLPTRSHPDAEPLGWQRFAELVDSTVLPVYALGGMQLDDLAQARLSGAQGIAGISGFLSD